MKTINHLIHTAGRSRRRASRGPLLRVLRPRHWHIPVRHTSTSLYVGWLTALLFLTACNSGGGGDEVTSSGGDQVVSATVRPVSGSPLGTGQAIVVTFNASMNPATLVFGGTAGAASGSWSTTTNSNDTLTVTPQSSWSGGFSKTLTVGAQNMTGAAASPINLVYDVLSAANLTYYYVNGSSGNDAANNGLSPSTPKRSVGAAIAAAASGSVVLVAAGDYLITSDPAAPTNIALKDGVSLYGGFSSDFASRDRQVYATAITDQSTAAAGNNEAMRAVGVTLATVVDGFTITGGGGTASAAIHTDNSSPTIRNNVLNGGTAGTTQAVWISNGSAPRIQDNTIDGGAAGTRSHGVYVENSSPTIERNRIAGGAANPSFGIFTSNAGGTLRNNTISGGSSASATTTYGIHANGTLTIQNNTVNGGPGSVYSYGIAYESGAIAIENNIIFTSGSGNRICIGEIQGVTNPARVRNNNLFNCPEALYVNFVPSGGNCPFWANGNCLTTAVQVNALVDVSGGANGNVSADPAFENQAGGDWRLTSATPSAVSQGALDLSASFSDDKDGTNRATPWGMGAFQRTAAGDVLKIFRTTTTTPSGNLGGVAGADAFCMTVANGYPGTGTYKSLIADGANRVASLTALAGDGQVDWVLKPNTAYFRADGVTLIGATDAKGLFTSDLTNEVSVTSAGYWNGLNTDWTTSTNTCSQWTNATSAATGRYGSEGSRQVGGMFLHWGDTACNVTAATLTCVQQ